MTKPAVPPREREVKIRLLSSLELFRSLTAEELGTVAQSSRWLSVPEGGSLFAGEEDGGRLYAIQEGEVLISKHGDEGRDISIATFVAGESFGELSLFEPQGEGTSARCERDSLLLVFPAAAGSGAAEQFFARHPAVGAKILHNLLAVVAQRIRTTNRLIAEKSPWVQELRRQVVLDKLTGLYNASFLEEDLVRMVEQDGHRVCLLMVKPDNLKALNDSYGHQAGDRTLQLMAAVLRACLGERTDASATEPQGKAIRYRGDVLAAVLPQAALRRARRIADEIRIAMKGLDLGQITGGKPVRFTVSLGVAESSPGVGASAGASAGALVERAYGNLFTARNRGGDRICAAGHGAPGKANPSE